MADIYQLGTDPTNMITTIEDLLGWAQRGELLNIALCAVNKEGDVLSACIAPMAIFSLLGGVTDMQRTITDKIERR